MCWERVFCDVDCIGNGVTFVEGRKCIPIPLLCNGKGITQCLDY